MTIPSRTPSNPPNPLGLPSTVVTALLIPTPTLSSGPPRPLVTLAVTGLELASTPLIYYDTFNLTDAAYLREVVSELFNNAHIWHQGMCFNPWEELKAEAKNQFIGNEPDPHHLFN
ncbi:hypothetical protein DSO57_1022528 [Entomophthora muscae]|uniref:Uncharacterized protein n=1 Tax=Entomophthora muscae TaxID=34485 RepID=A0ACC2RUA4_9FUNG|nr:hypothetical protein DSO57_1022528 [Entomophthora muscae]